MFDSKQMNEFKKYVKTRLKGLPVDRMDSKETLGDIWNGGFISAFLEIKDILEKLEVGVDINSL